MFESIKKTDAVEVVKVLHIEMGPDDILILRIQGNPTDETLKRVKESVQQSLGANRKVLVMSGEFEFVGVIGSK